LAKSLLIVDDNAELRRLLRVLVEDLFDECFECADGVAAVAAYQEHHPDWVLMDIQMKGGDGLSATQQITAAAPEAKIVIVTHFASAKMQAAARAAGAIGFVSKDNLLEVRHVLDS
jgi:CheY-like chemotaxis protein